MKISQQVNLGYAVNAVILIHYRPTVLHATEN